ncbi:MAG: hypothetical protein K9M75_09480, partial [Phycisphaerae bacterium]|nr:hypothetical protein [Phycisphaerae bacterium]
MKKLMLTAMVMLAVAAVANAALVPIVDVTGFSGGDSYPAGDFTPLTNGVGTANPDPADPSTWTNSGTSYKD